MFQRMPWGGGKRRGEETLTKDTPPAEKGPFVRFVFHPPSVAIGLFLLYKSPHLRRPEALLEGFQTFSGGCVLWCVFLPPYVLLPPYHGPKCCFTT